MMNSRLASLLLAGACAALVGASGCTSSNTPTPAHGRLLSDLDGDGLFASPECDDPRPVIDCGGPGSDGHVEPGDDGNTPGTNTGCTVVPGPDGCVFLEVTGGSVPPGGPDASTGNGSGGGTGSDGGTSGGSGAECYQCLDENMHPVGEPVCAPPNPISCEVTGSAGPTDPNSPTNPTNPTNPNDPGSTCWTCTDGETTYTECYTPPTSCAVDADCAEGETCVTPEVGCPEGADVCAQPAVEGYCLPAGGGGGGEPTPPPVPQPF